MCEAQTACDRNEVEVLMNSGKDRNARIIEELRKSMTTEDNAEDKTYTFRQYTVDGQKFSTLANLQSHEIKIVTPEEAVIAGFTKLLSQSTDQKTREFARTINNIVWLHESGKEDLKNTPVYQIAKEYSDRTLSTRPGSIERDLVLITAIEKIKSSYRTLISEEI